MIIMIANSIFFCNLRHSGWIEFVLIYLSKILMDILFCIITLFAEKIIGLVDYTNIPCYQFYSTRRS